MVKVLMGSNATPSFVTGLSRGSSLVAPRGAWTLNRTSLSERGSTVRQNGYLVRTGNRCVLVPMQLVSHVHTMTEFANHLIVSCGVGLAGIFGGKVTEHTRLLLHGDRKQDMMEKMSAEVDSFRRRKELRENVSTERIRDWSDVNVDSLANVVVVQPSVPPLPAYDELHRFDSLLGHSDPNVINGKTSMDESSLPPASEFLIDDE